MPFRVKLDGVINVVTLKGLPFIHEYVQSPAFVTITDREHVDLILLFKVPSAEAPKSKGRLQK